MSDPKPISFDAQEDDALRGKEEASAGDIYRGNTMVANTNMAGTSMDIKTSQQQGKAASMEQQTRNFGGKSTEIMTLETDGAGFKSKGAQLQGNEPQNKFVLEVVPSYNDIASLVAPKQSPADVISSLSTILSDYPSDIAFDSKPDDGTIENGVVFVNNFYSVFFTIWTVKDGDDTRFEFRRSSGDALAAAKFLGDIKSRFFGDKESSENEAGSGIAMDLDTSGLEELKTSDEQKEMMMVHEALIQDDVVQDSLEENAENYLLGKMVEAKAIVKGQDKIEHDKLTDALLDRSVLLHGDLSVVRAALVMLAKLVNEGFGAKVTTKASFEALKEVLEAQKCDIVKGYVLALIKTLTEKSADGMKSVDESAREALKGQLKTFESGCDKKKYSGFEGVYEKL